MEENKYSYLYILEYSYPGIYELELSKEDTERTSEDILEKYGFNIYTCSIMYTENKLELEILKE